MISGRVSPCVETGFVPVVSERPVCDAFAAPAPTTDLAVTCADLPRKSPANAFASCSSTGGKVCDEATVMAAADGIPSNICAIICPLPILSHLLLV